MPRLLVWTLAVLLSACVSAFASTGSRTPSHLLPPSSLLCDGQQEPLAVADAQPRFSWQLAASAQQLHGVRQTAFQIQVLEAGKDFAAPLWESGQVESAATAGIAYAGPPLKAGRAYAWRVRVWDEKQNPSAWSGAAHWSQAPVWQCAMDCGFGK